MRTIRASSSPSPHPASDPRRSRTPRESSSFPPKSFTLTRPRRIFSSTRRKASQRLPLTAALEIVRALAPLVPFPPRPYLPPPPDMGQPLGNPTGIFSLMEPRLSFHSPLLPGTQLGHLSPVPTFPELRPTLPLSRGSSTTADASLGPAAHFPMQKCLVATQNTSPVSFLANIRHTRFCARSLLSVFLRSVCLLPPCSGHGKVKTSIRKPHVPVRSLPVGFSFSPEPREGCGVTIGRVCSPSGSRVSAAAPFPFILPVWLATFLPASTF
ncbi:hypothetical protein VUR80DRAFT_5065 [Thermomyces stellatus]